MKKIILCFHGGSLNRGCEAICRSIYKILKNNEIILYSFNKQEDVFVGLDKFLEIKHLNINHFNKLSITDKILKLFKQIFLKKTKYDYILSFQALLSQHRNCKYSFHAIQKEQDLKVRY